MKQLTPYERWMVRSNLETVREAAGAGRGHAEAVAAQVATLRENGYGRVAAGVEQAAREGAE